MADGSFIDEIRLTLCLIPLLAARELENLIESTASSNICRYWVNREEDGGGTLERGKDSFRVGNFPSFLISDNWTDDGDLSLVNEYIEWIAPSLLTLQTLSHYERDRLENYLNVQAVSIEHHWNLYPEIVDETKLTAARVQCRLQKS